MKLTFLGAAHEVTGSATYLEAGGKRLLVDCGMEQGKDIFVNQTLPVNADQIDSVFLTHAHIDHSGNLPLLYKQGYRGPVYATEATKHLCEIMLEDCARIQESEAAWQNRKNGRAGRDAVEPLYTSDDVRGILSQFVPLPYGVRTPAEENIDVRFGNAGHLLGAAHIELWLRENGEERKVVFSGDVGNSGRPLIDDPQPVEEADYVILESTYGDRLHAPHEGDRAYTLQLPAILDRTFARGGNVVIPSFAVGRTQELLFFLRRIKEEGLVKSRPHFRVVLDSPLAVEATAIFQQTLPAYYDDETRSLLENGIDPVFFPDLTVSVSSEESKALNTDPEPKVILSSSGMCEAGRIRHHLKHNLWRPECTVLFVGYQTEGTLGRILLDGADKVKLFGEEIRVKAELATIDGISGHADRDGLAAWLNAFKKRPARVFINHGEAASVDHFAEYLKKEYGWKTEAPYSGASFDLLKDRWLRRAKPFPVRREAPAETAYAALCAAAEKLLALVRSMKGRTNKELKDMTGELEELTEKHR